VLVTKRYLHYIGKRQRRRKAARFPHEVTPMAAGHPNETTPPAAGAAPDPSGHVPETCARISELLARVGDKWTLLVIRSLSAGPMRFNALRREIGDISQKMLATTLRALERDGFVSRKVTPVTPPQVEYALTDLGQELQVPVNALAQWTAENSPRIEAARAAFDRPQGRQAA
jgi:DNA-binding HxlR family transcriptional regulator